MSAKSFVLCLCIVLFFSEVKTQVCTRTTSTFVQTFTMSDGVIKNPKAQTPIYEVFKKCCPGYAAVDPLKEASSINCLPICKKQCSTSNCADGQQCVCPKNYIKDDKGYLCLPICPSGQMDMNGTCEIIAIDPGMDTKIDIKHSPIQNYSSFELNNCNNSSATCLPLTNEVSKNKTCPDKEPCVCPDKHVNDTTGTLCIPHCSPDHYYVNGTCQQIVNQGTGIDNQSVETGKCNHTKSYKNLFYVSASANFIMFLIVIILTINIFKNNKTHDRERNANMADCRNSPHSIMIGAHRNYPVELPQYESVQESSMSDGVDPQYLDMGHRRNCANEPSRAENALTYDYVQTPLPIHLRKLRR